VTIYPNICHLKLVNSAEDPRAHHVTCSAYTPRAPRHAFHGTSFREALPKAATCGHHSEPGPRSIKWLSAKQSGPDPSRLNYSTGILGYGLLDKIRFESSGVPSSILSSPRARVFPALLRLLQGMGIFGFIRSESSGVPGSFLYFQGTGVPKSADVPSSDAISSPSTTAIFPLHYVHRIVFGYPYDEIVTRIVEHDLCA